MVDVPEALFALPLFPIATLLGALEVLDEPAAAFSDATRPATPVLFAEADGEVARPFDVFSDNGAAVARASVDMMAYPERKLIVDGQADPDPSHGGLRDAR
jgi:hypothetical protein